MASSDLADIDAFMAVARSRSFRAAAVIKGVSASGLSEAVRRVEARLGARLLNRTTRSVTPTQAGALLIARLGPALGEVAAALDAVTGIAGTNSGVLRLNAPTFVAEFTLPRIIAPFLKEHPGITVDILADDLFVDVLAAGFDAGIRYEERLEQDMIAIPLGPRRQRFAIAATPEYLRQHGRPEHPRDLLRHACIRHRFPNGNAPVWEFERAGEVIRLVGKACLFSNVIGLNVQAAIAGLGVIFQFEDVLAPGLASGALEPVLREWWQEFSGPFLYYPSRTLMPGPLRAFVTFVQAQQPT